MNLNGFRVDVGENHTYLCQERGLCHIGGVLRVKSLHYLCQIKHCLEALNERTSIFSPYYYYYYYMHIFKPNYIQLWFLLHWILIPHIYLNFEIWMLDQNERTYDYNHFWRFESYSEKNITMCSLAWIKFNSSKQRYKSNVLSHQPFYFIQNKQR
jgi:hypothetical protein